MTGGFMMDNLEPRKLLSGLTNDTLSSSQFALEQSGVSEAWRTTTGSAAVITANLDSGADYTHEDLYLNVWINQAEIPSAVRSRARDTDRDGVLTFWDFNHRANRGVVADNNRNGYIDAGDVLRSTTSGGWEDGRNGRSNSLDTFVDDIIGWDFAENDNNPFDDGSANGGHGTQTAGVIAAIGNNSTGISGVVQKGSLLIARIFNDLGNAVSDATLALAIRYTADSGAKVSNNSYGGSFGFNGDVIYRAIEYAGSKGQLFVVAAGNDGRNIDSRRANVFPAEYALANILVVSATTSSGSLASFSNFGALQTDLAAPGANIVTTSPGNTYEAVSGTSFATPLVAGSAALLLSANNQLTTAQLKQRLINGADESQALDNRSVSDGKLNLGNAVTNRSGFDFIAPVAQTPSTNPSTTITIRGNVVWFAPIFWFGGHGNSDVFVWFV